MGETLVCPKLYGIYIDLPPILGHMSISNHGMVSRVADIFGEGEPVSQFDLIQGFYSIPTKKEV